jgi:hypothetical protein
MAQAEKMLLDEQIVIPLTVGTTREMKKPYVKGMYPNAATLHAWKYVISSGTRRSGITAYRI